MSNYNSYAIPHMIRHLANLVALCVVATTCPYVRGAPRADGQLEIEVVDKETGQPIAARIHLQTTRKRPVPLKLPGTAAFGDHFYIDGRLALPLRRGQFVFDIDAGPEYRTQTGHFEIDRHADDAKQIEMTRFADLAKEGWYAADLDFDRPKRDLPPILRAEHLQDVRTSEYATTLGLGSGGWPAVSLSKPGLGKNSNTLSPAPSPQHPVARDKVAIAATPFDWNLPVWLASGKLDAINLINRHSLRDGVVDNEGDGRPRDRSLFTGHTGNGRWSTTIYYHVLNCGFRIAPVAGSGSGVNDNPVGTNRVYVYCDDEFSPESWWQGLQVGRVFVTNGPLLRPIVEGRPPGYVFHIDGTEKLTLEIGLNLATRVPVEYLEIIQNGELYTDVRLSEWKQKKGRLPPVEFKESGWFLVRAVTNHPKTYQFASSGPYYVEKEGTPRISRRSVQFFLDWIDAAEAHIREQNKLDNATRDSLLAEQATAREFFQKLLATANAE
jgi:hypothetical protein